MDRTPENTPRQDTIQPPNPPVRNNIQYLNLPNDLRGLQIPQNLERRNNNPQEGNNDRPNLAPRNNQNIPRR